LRKGWRMVERNQGKIHDLVLDMLSYSKEREPAVEMTLLAPIVADVLEIVKGRTDDMKVRLEIRTSPQMPPVPADPEGVHRALLNIVSNALDALYDRPDPYLGIQTAIEPGNEWAKIMVVDHGHGIAADKIADIFRPFVSSKGAKGTGLGLAVSRKILREHGGDILVQSQEGRGSKFTLRLPLKSPLLNDSAASGSREFPSAPDDD